MTATEALVTALHGVFLWPESDYEPMAVETLAHLPEGYALVSVEEVCRPGEYPASPASVSAKLHELFSDRYAGCEHREMSPVLPRCVGDARRILGLESRP